ncbi:MAG: ice-binding family protein [Polaromonas sp.]|jgi:hypothetical protein|nr:ice-binding family protein [Polaromonas sp.]
MKKFTGHSKTLSWSVAVLLTALAAGCGGGGRDPVLGADVSKAVLVAPPGAIAPGAVCPVAGPSVTVTNPANGNLAVTTSTSGVANNGKLVTATFSEAMNAATINAATFKLAPTGGIALVPASVSYNAANKVATLTTSSALMANTAYTAVIQAPIANGTGTPIGCNYAWNFKTAATLAASPPSSFDLGLAATYAIAATAGVTNAAATTINGNVVLDPNATCNAESVLAAGTFGLCAGKAPTLNGVVASPLFPDAGITSGAVKANLRATYIALSPAILTGATAIPAGTTLGEPPLSALVQGDNYFVPGVYQSSTSILITGDVTLDAQGDENAEFVFQSSSTVGTDPNAQILLIGGAKASNVYWWAGSAATLKTNTAWQGNILASDNVTMQLGASSCGRLFAGASTDGAFVLDGNVVSVPGNSSGPATCQ